MSVVSRTRIVKLTKWCPPNDPLAAKIARLCILREDFLLEINGFFTEGIKELDSLSEEWRRLYFVRNLIRTLREMESGIQRLLSDPEFKALLATQDANVQEEFAKHAGLMAKGIQVLFVPAQILYNRSRSSILSDFPQPRLAFKIRPNRVPPEFIAQRNTART